MPGVILLVAKFTLLLAAAPILLGWVLIAVEAPTSSFSLVSLVPRVSTFSFDAMVVIAAVAISNPPFPQGFKRARMLRNRHKTRATCFLPEELKYDNNKRNKLSVLQFASVHIISMSYNSNPHSH